MPIRRLFEPRLGKSFASNLVIREARGDFILWTDDDVLVDPNWMVAYSRAFIRWPSASVFGGPIRPWFSGTPPEWLDRVLRHVAGAYGIRDLGDEPIVLGEKTAPYGANVAIRAVEQTRHFYDTDLGPRGEHYSTGEDVELVRRILAEGNEGRWVPDAILWHYIPRDAQTLGHIQAHYKAYGNYCARQMERGKQPMLFGMPQWVLRQTIGVPVKYMKYRIRRIARRPEVWIKDLIAFSMAWGMLERAKHRRRHFTRLSPLH